MKSKCPRPRLKSAHAALNRKSIDYSALQLPDSGERYLSSALVDDLD